MSAASKQLFNHNQHRFESTDAKPLADHMLVRNPRKWFGALYWCTCCCAVMQLYYHCTLELLCPCCFQEAVQAAKCVRVRHLIHPHIWCNMVVIKYSTEVRVVTSSRNGGQQYQQAEVLESRPHCWRRSRSPRRCHAPCQQTRRSGSEHTPVHPAPTHSLHEDMGFSRAWRGDVGLNQTRLL